MNPHQKNKVDINSLSADEQRLFRLYGKLPNKKDLLQNKLKERKYFDSGDYALSKAGKAGDTGVTAIGTEHPSAEDIPHKMHPLTNTLSRGDSVSGASPPNNNSTLGNAGVGDGSAPTLSGNSPAGMHRGSINGIPGGGMPGVQGISRSPNKETSHLARSSSMDEDNDDTETEDSKTTNLDGNISPPPKTEGIPIRR